MQKYFNVDDKFRRFREFRIKRFY